MHKNFLLLLTFLLAACSSAPTPAVSISPLMTSTPRATPTPPPCTALDIAPTPGPEQPSLFPPVSESDHVYGPPDASVTILEYSDFQ